LDSKVKPKLLKQIKDSLNEPLFTNMQRSTASSANITTEDLDEEILRCNTTMTMPKTPINKKEPVYDRLIQYGVSRNFKVENKRLRKSFTLYSHSPKINKKYLGL